MQDVNWCTTLEKGMVGGGGVLRENPNKERG
jgi:hypothetical protein